MDSSNARLFTRLRQGGKGTERGGGRREGEREYIYTCIYVFNKGEAGRAECRGEIIRYTCGHINEESRTTGGPPFLEPSLSMTTHKV